MAGNSAGSVLVNIFTAPSAAFAAIKERPRVLLPLLILMLGTFAVQFTYLQVVDFPWLMDQQLQQGPGSSQMTEAQRNQTVEAMTRIPPAALGAIQGVSGAIVI